MQSSLTSDRRRGGEEGRRGGEEGRWGGGEEGRRDLLKGAEHWCYDGVGDFPDARGGHG